MRVTYQHCNQTADVAPTDALSCPSCGSQIQSLIDRTVTIDPNLTTPFAALLDPSEAMPDIVGGYRLRHRLGIGGMGTVYEAEHLQTGERVALKLIRPEFALTPEVVDRFRREGRFASAISHPRCVFVRTADEDAGRPYIILELMPGDTLKDLVDREGPLPPDRAIPLILDVLEGLDILHERGIIHRDMKPGNCFLEGNEHVKVGDFGLALSLLGQEDDERSRFAGTPLFSSPEQLRGKKLDLRSDLFSVSATLYYLLTGRPPFPGRNVASILEHMEKDVTPSPRTVQPDIPPALERVVQRGLLHKRGERWQNVQQLRLALLRFGPARLTEAGVWMRVGAYFLDSLLVLALIAVVYFPLAYLADLFAGKLSSPFKPHATYDWCSNTVSFEPINPLAFVLELLYFWLLEGLFGCGLGKWHLGLRIVRPGENKLPGLRRTFVRTAIFLAIMYWPRLFLPYIRLDCTSGLFLALLSWWNIGGGLMLLSTMRERNGYRGPHDFLSGLCVQFLVRPESARRARLRLPGFESQQPAVERPSDVPARIGPFSVRHAICWQQGTGVLAAEDPRVERQVWLWLRDRASAECPLSRRDINRLSRLRWLDGGIEGDNRWDAFVAGGGVPLKRVVAGVPLSWEDTRLLLMELTAELASACAEQTLPQPLTLDQVLVRPTGEILLVDPPLSETAPEDDKRLSDVRALDLLRRVVLLCLEGKEPAEGEAPPRINAPLPLHARAMLKRLLQTENSFASVQEFRDQLTATDRNLTSITRMRRLALAMVQAGIFTAAALAILISIEFINRWARGENPFIYSRKPDALELIPLTTIFWLLPVCSLLVAMERRGGLGFPLCGLALVHADGRRAGVWQAAGRSLLRWLEGSVVLGGVPVLLLLLVNKMQDQYRWWCLGGWLSFVAIYATLLHWLPRRGWIDRVVRTYVVPR
jgi:uncharacterized RDD family membrane protein YckC